MPRAAARWRKASRHASKELLALWARTSNGTAAPALAASNARTSNARRLRVDDGRWSITQFKTFSSRLPPRPLRKCWREEASQSALDWVRQTFAVRRDAVERTR